MSASTFVQYTDVTAAPSEILAAMKETPIGHPSRAVLRERAIKAWLAQLGVSRMQVSRLMARALQCLRDLLGPRVEF